MATTLGMNNPSDKELVKNAYNTQNQSGYSFGLINPTTGISFNTISPSLGTLNLNRGLGDIAAGVSIGPGSGYSKKIEANKVANKDVSKEDTSSVTEQAPGTKRMLLPKEVLTYEPGTDVIGVPGRINFKSKKVVKKIVANAYSYICIYFFCWMG